LAKIDYPAILVGDPVIEPVTTTIAVEKVWPDYVHVYPGGTNPVAVTVRNFTSRPVEAVVHLEMQTGLDEVTPVGDAKLTIPALDTATTKFPWISGTRDFGYGAVATVSVDGKAVHTNAEYFSVGTPIWKTAIQGSGFLTWYNRERLFPSHVKYNRQEYINVEEAFSWQPSSWTDLNPTTDDWWSGQGNAHNSRSGLLQWSSLSHSNGIKLITYCWPTASGKAGFDEARECPDILCRYGDGTAVGVDSEDLSIRGITQNRPELWQYQSGIWISNFINMGLLRAIDHLVQEVVRSSRTFGWDGMRFDYPPGWSAMGSGDVQHEFDVMGVTNLMKQLLPEYYGTTNESWSGDAITIRNLRYFRHMFDTQLSKNFALSYNGGGGQPLTPEQARSFSWECQGGGQIMDESIRGTGAMSNYMETALMHSESMREVGGYTCVFQAERCPAPLAAIYSTIFTFAAGSHPYGDYGWLSPMPGTYTQFMTRYGEYCWDLALAPVTPEKAGVTVESKTPLLWERFIRQRETNGVLQTVVHLIAQPTWDEAKSLTQCQLEWPRDVMVRKQCKSEPTVWLLTAEPETSATQLTVVRHENGYSVTVPSVHLWSLLVWSEKP
jgi:hypothetical protein